MCKNVAKRNAQKRVTKSCPVDIFVRHGICDHHFNLKNLEPISYSDTNDVDTGRPPHNNVSNATVPAYLLAIIPISLPRLSIFFEAVIIPVIASIRSD